MIKTIGVAVFLLVATVAGFGQTSYKGLTPGKSTRAEVERVLGQPVTKVSETLIGYRPQTLAGRIFVQYRKVSSVVEKIEMLCQTESSTCEDFIASLKLRLPANSDSDAINDQKWKAFYGTPHFIVMIRERSQVTNNITPVSRLALYSRELYEADVARIKQANEADFAGLKQANEADPEKTDGPTISGGILNAKAIDMPAPVYPPAARATSISGMVMVRVTIDEQGRVIEAAAVSGHPLLRAAAVEAARQARFNPAAEKLTGRLTYRFERE